MIRGRCPTCSKPFEVGTLDDLPSLPCSERRTGQTWAAGSTGAYAIPGPDADPPDRDNDADPGIADDEN